MKSGKILSIEDFEEIDPQSPIGGPDGTKDILCSKNGKSYLVGCYFPNGQKHYSDILEKFESDYAGVEKNGAEGFVFISNQKITPTERANLVSRSKVDTTIYHGERVCSILDSPKGYGIRLEYLGIEIKKEEQISFLDSYLDLKKNFQEIKEKLNRIESGKSEPSEKLKETVVSNLPIAGVKFTSRLSIEDLVSIHSSCLLNSKKYDFKIFLGLRNTDVQIMSFEKDKRKILYTPPSSKDVPSLIYNLLVWWREEFSKVFYSGESDKIELIAKFHERFLSIHPFLDGNGRVSRILSSLQFKDLLDKNVIFDDIDKQNYFDSLQKAREGDNDKLIDIFKSLISKSP
jgi:hypothetical protein